MLRKKGFLIKTLILTIIILILIIAFNNNSNNSEINKDNFLNKININKSINKDKSFNKSIIYFSRHDGTIGNFKTIGELLNFNVTVISPSYRFQDRPKCFLEDKCKNFVNKICSQYDFVIVSDIIPDSYIFLINECQTKIILEITNRFDVLIDEKNKIDFYEQFGKAIIENKNITVVENNPYEVFYACQNGIFIPNYYLIRPVGFAPDEVLAKKYKISHEEIAIIDRTDQDSGVSSRQLKKYKIKHRILNKDYGGPLVLANYKALIILPYQVSIMKMMENFRYGVVMLIPTEKLFRELSNDFYYEFPEKDLKDVPNGLSNYMEWYNKEFKDLFIYFDSWEELPSIIENTDFSKYKKKEMNYMKKYEEKAINLWAQVLDIIPSKDKISDDQPICDNKIFYNYNISIE
ncbi:hypothetical protein H8356DRAFT_1052285 [Neocallimastix lanati (nom. inval.)]|jgi:hypothetical protein|nr:hypothetical protein H8356DRAFT_1052285 [Neocallimastix sp. JGI-2020a]